MIIRELPFEPCPLLSHPHLQTILPNVVAWVAEPGSEPLQVLLEDGEKLVLEVTTPRGWQKTDPTVFCVHGFGGSHKSNYMVRAARKFQSLGIRVIRFNARGAGSGKGLAKKLFNMNFASDVLAAIRYVKELEPTSPLTVIGFSLGGNAVLRMVGDLGKDHGGLVEKVIAIAPPVDLSINPSGHRSLYPGWEWCLSFYDRYFYQHIRKEFVDLSKMFTEIPQDVLPENWSMHLFTTGYLVSTFGEGNPDRYFFEGSALHAMDRIEVPCKILFAQDDPIVLHHLLDEKPLPDHVEVYKTRKGGHIGYLGNPLKPHGFYWLDSLLVDWVLNK